ncbi:MAG: YraN family protein [Firmicutes bacterium]|nr:YraN family protein [Bacillota bacterium]
MNLRRQGNRYEHMAAGYLKERGYKIVARQFRCRQGEIDIIAEDGALIVFVEVKGRRTCAFGLPEEAVDWRKQNRIRQAAEYFLWSRQKTDHLCRFDVVAVYDKGPQKCQINHIKSAFS